MNQSASNNTPTTKPVVSSSPKKPKQPKGEISKNNKKFLVKDTFFTEGLAALTRSDQISVPSISKSAEDADKISKFTEKSVSYKRSPPKPKSDVAGTENVTIRRKKDIFVRQTTPNSSNENGATVHSSNTCDHFDFVDVSHPIVKTQSNSFATKSSGGLAVSMKPSISTEVKNGNAKESFSDVKDSSTTTESPENVIHSEKTNVANTDTASRISLANGLTNFAEGTIVENNLPNVSHASTSFAIQESGNSTFPERVNKTSNAHPSKRSCLKSMQKKTIISKMTGVSTKKNQRNKHLTAAGNGRRTEILKASPKRPVVDSISSSEDDVDEENAPTTMENPYQVVHLFVFQTF